MISASRYADTMTPSAATMTVQPLDHGEKQWATLIDARSEKSAWRLAEIGCELYPCELELTWSGPQGQEMTARLSLGARGAVRVCVYGARLLIRVASLVDVIWAVGSHGPVATNAQRVWVTISNGYAETHNCHELTLMGAANASVTAELSAFARKVRVELSMPGYESTLVELYDSNANCISRCSIRDMPADGLWVGSAAWLSVALPAGMTVRVLSFLSL